MGPGGAPVVRLLAHTRRVPVTWCKPSKNVCPQDAGASCRLLGRPTRQGAGLVALLHRRLPSAGVLTTASAPRISHPVRSRLRRATKGSAASSHHQREWTRTLNGPKRVQKTGEHPRQNDLDVCTVEINVWFILLNGCLVTLCPTCAQGRVRHPRNNPTVDQG